MFRNLHGSDLIFIWVGELSVEDDLLKAVRSLRITRDNGKEKVVEGASGTQKAQLKIPSMHN